MTVEVNVPDIGDFSDVPVVTVLVSVGDVIAVEDPIVELESDKATMEVPSSAAGKVVEIKVAEGDTVSEGSLILLLEGEGAAAAPAEKPAEAPAEAAPAPAPAAAPAAAPVVTDAGFGKAHASPSVRALVGEAQAALWIGGRLHALDDAVADDDGGGNGRGAVGGEGGMLHCASLQALIAHAWSCDDFQCTLACCPTRLAEGDGAEGGVVAQAVHERSGIDSLAQSTEALKGTPNVARLVDLSAVMADFDGEIERMFRFLGADDPSKCVRACRPLDVPHPNARPSR